MASALLSASCSGVASESVSGATSFERNVLTRDFEAANQTALETENALQDFTATCMRGSGFDYLPLNQAQEAEYASRMQSIMQDGVSFPADSTEAAVRGFGIADALLTAKDAGLMDGSPEVPGMSENEAYVADLTDTEAEAYAYELGVCQEKAVDTIAPTYVSGGLLSDIEAAVSQRLAGNPQYVQLVGEWLQCMRSEGLLSPQMPVDEPHEFLALVQQDLIASISDITDNAASETALDDLRTSEIGLAQAALDCGADAAFFTLVAEIRDAEVVAELDRRGL